MPFAFNFNLRPDSAALLPAGVPVFTSPLLRARRLAEALHACAGGRELTTHGRPQDVDLAAALDADPAAPVLADGAYVGT